MDQWTEMEQLQRIQGVVDSVTFRNEQSGWTVLELAIEFGQLATVVGVMPEVYAGEQLSAEGSWGEHPSFGPQFEAKTIERSLPNSASTILRYLSSGAIKGIGPATASRLVGKFGDKTLEVLEKQPERLSEIKGISPTKARIIAEDYARKFGVREATVYLAQFGVTVQEAAKAWKKWGSRTIEQVKSDPYSLCGDPVNLGFERADEIATQMGMEKDDLSRMRAGVLYVLRHNLNNGHTCLPREKVCEVSSHCLDVDKDATDYTIQKMLEDGELESEQLESGEFLYLPYLHKAESYVAGRLQMMMEFAPNPCANVEENIQEVERQEGMQYGNLQRQAIYDALLQGILILTGGPGTGKTTTINAMIQLLEKNGEKVALAAPTGRAAKRISEVTNREAKTIHRLLEVEWTPNDRPVFGRNERNPLDYDSIIVDELSMVDIVLFENLLRAMRLGCRLILVGDADQLPSVGAGNVLHDLIASGKLPVVSLEEVFRQAQSSLIVTNAHRIIHGEMPELSSHSGDFFFLDTSAPDQISKTIVDLCTTRLPAAYGYSPQLDLQVLCPGKKGPLGTFQLNQVLQGSLNPSSKEKKEASVYGQLFREGDKVMQIRNNYCITWERDDGTQGEGVFNGDVGTLVKIDTAAGLFTVRYEDRMADYTSEMLSDLQLAYAVTVHKSQGSEFPAVVMPMYPGAPQLCYRNLLYTAVTRAKSLIVMVGRRSVVQNMVFNHRKTKRYSGLRDLLCRDDGLLDSSTSEVHCCDPLESD
ncbi:SF1B family DNA helicase RecD2 [Solibaculum mannosilyticum]|uniref:ATP-dependent RecD2 DNA helicase n=1 Tax=Solibaculum mannosilyticum TaxID=2780922 RepID=A0A7I8D5S2_9FIRM|nr:ATP-dependent RecD-like DNA helicase [Solibaculum mannosilyticum]BCI60533.1 ATP-dependent RecD-like DNA helicase [Solibaculum mannosilyticum]